MRVDRPYRARLGVEEAKAELLGRPGTQFDLDVVDAFLALPLPELRDIRVERTALA